MYMGASGHTYCFYRIARDLVGNVEASKNTAEATTQVSLPVMTWANPFAIANGTPLGPTQLNATASVPGAFVYTLPAGTMLNVGNGQTLSVTFTPTNCASCTPVMAKVQINATPDPLTVTANPGSRYFGSSNPLLTDAIAGLVNNDNTTAMFTTTATPGSPPGHYTITPVYELSSFHMNSSSFPYEGECAADFAFEQTELLLY